ncbi:MAG: sugar ABC transporter permease [Acidimicrobiales bacterium]
MSLTTGRLPASPRPAALATSGPRSLMGISSAQLRSFGLVGILILVAVVFQILTGGIFLSARNLTNLSGQVAITAILAAGIVLVMIPGFIDLSIGATVSFAAVIAAMASATYGFTFWETVVAVLAVGLLIGAWHALWVAWLEVPAFIVTLSSLLAIRGISLVLTDSQTISPADSLLVIADTALSSTWSILLPLILWAAFAALQVREWRARLSAGIPATFASTVGVPVGLGAIVLAGAVATTVSYRGLPLPVAIVLAVIAVTSFVLRYTAFGRRLYAIGGNRQAAELAGVNLHFHGIMVLLGMGLLYGVAGLVLVARLDSAPPGAEVGLELNVIAAAVIGGTSLMGGRGTVMGAVLGAVLMESLANGMSLMNLPSAYQSITVGLVLLLAVYADIRSRGTRASAS